MGQREPFASGVGQLGLLTHGGNVASPWSDGAAEGDLPEDPAGV